MRYWVLFFWSQFGEERRTKYLEADWVPGLQRKAAEGLRGLGDYIFVL